MVTTLLKNYQKLKLLFTKRNGPVLLGNQDSFVGRLLYLLDVLTFMVR